MDTFSGYLMFLDESLEFLQYRRGIEQNIYVGQ